MKRFEVIIHDEPHPSRNGRRYTINANGRVKLSDSQRECVRELAEMLLAEPKPIMRKAVMPEINNNSTGWNEVY